MRSSKSASPSLLGLEALLEEAIHAFTVRRVATGLALEAAFKIELSCEAVVKRSLKRLFGQAHAECWL